MPIQDPEGYSKQQTTERVIRLAWSTRDKKSVVRAEAVKLLTGVVPALADAPIKNERYSLQTELRHAELFLQIPDAAEITIKLQNQHIGTSQGTVVVDWDPETASFVPAQQWKQYTPLDALLHVALTELFTAE